MKELMKNYKVWLIASLTLLIMLAAVCISFSGNYHELEGYREKEYNAAEQQKVISKLTEENTRLKTENTSVQSADSLTEIIQEYIKSYYNSDGTESENEKALKVRKYVTDELFEQMYDKTEKPESFAPNEQIRQTALIQDIVYEANRKYQALAYVTMEIRYEYPDGKKDSQNVLLRMEFKFDKDNSVWKLSGLSSSTIKLQRVWG